MNLIIYIAATWISMHTVTFTILDISFPSRMTPTYKLLPKKRSNEIISNKQTEHIQEIRFMADTCYFVGPGDSIFLFPNAPAVTLTPEVICSSSVLTIHITGTLRNKGAKWVIYTSGCGVGTPLGSTRGNSFVDASLSNGAFYVREETCLIGTTTYNIKGACGSAAVAFNLADTDGDGTNDCVDGCPLNAAKTSPGECGCGIPDLDTDVDGTADCIDTDDDNDGQSDEDEIACSSDPLDDQSISADNDDDLIPDCADSDDDNDSVKDDVDNCPYVFNVNQRDIDLDGLGNACDAILDVAGVIQNSTEIIANNINNPGLRQSLTNNLNHALSAYCNGRTNQALNLLNAFKNEVLAQSGKKISISIANELLNLTQAIIHAINNNIAQCPPSELKFIPLTSSNLPSISRLYPNPASQEVWLDLSPFQEGNVKIKLTDIKGTVLREWKSDPMNNGKINLNLYGLSPGLYIVKIQNGPDKTAYKLIIK